jgi:hypothetical protein
MNAVIDNADVMLQTKLGIQSCGRSMVSINLQKVNAWIASRTQVATPNMCVGYLMTNNVVETRLGRNGTGMVGHGGIWVGLGTTQVWGNCVVAV